jgi:hypothetical protein
MNKLSVLRESEESHCTTFCNRRYLRRIFNVWGTRWRSWLRQCATSRKVAGSIPDGVTGIFHWYNPSYRTMALGLTQPITEISAGNNSWGVKAAGAYSWPYRLRVLIVLKSEGLNFLEPVPVQSPYKSVQACTGIVLPLPTSIRSQNLSWKNEYWLS